MSNNVSFRSKTIYFKRLEFKKHPIYDLSIILHNLLDKCKKQNYEGINDLILDDKHIFLYAIEPFNESDDKDNPYHVYALDISCIDTDQEVQFGDLTQQVRQRVKTPEEIQHRKNKDKFGELVSTRILIDPHRHIIEMCRGMNQLSQKNTMLFLRKLFNHEDIIFNLVLNKNAYHRVSNMTYIDKFEYKIATPSAKSPFYNRDNENELSILNDRYKYGTQSFDMTQTIRSSNSYYLRRIRQYMKLLLTGKLKNNIIKAKISGKDKNGNDEQVNYLRNELKYKGYLKYKNRITYHNYFQLLIEAYQKECKYLNTLFPTENEARVSDEYNV